jgi:hypothetical protein
MKTRLSIAGWLVVMAFFTSAGLRAEGGAAPVLGSTNVPPWSVPPASNSPPLSAVASNYQVVIQQTEPLMNILGSTLHTRSNLEAFFSLDLQQMARSTNWRSQRLSLARGILTNLAAMELGIKATAYATNKSLPPPEVWDWHAKETLADPVKCDQIARYRVAAGRLGKLWNRHQSLNVARLGFAPGVMSILVEAYNLPPPAGQEARSLVAEFAGFQCSLEFSNRLHSAQSLQSQKPAPRK